MDRQLSEHFSLEELCYSRVGIENGLLNVPPPEGVMALRHLCTDLLEPLRERLGEPLHVLSGYRCAELNRLVGGVRRSQHLLGEAADLYTPNLAALVAILRAPDAPEFDQGIVYRRRGFVHVSLKLYGANRREFFFV